MKKVLLANLLISFFALIITPTFAVECDDNDKDWYISYDSCTVESCDVTKDDAIDEGNCPNIKFKKWVEPDVCDARTLDPDSGLFDSDKYDNEKWKNYNPKATDIPNNWKDENCDWKDWNSIMNSWDKDIKDVIKLIIDYIAYIAIAVSVVVFIYGWIMYSTASWDDAKISKARKALIWALIWAAIWLFAPTIVWSVINMLS